ncbi:hypothetical protein DRH29_03145 [candidate division Kazan bacterium]|uniref:Uncharacterized protein n=1 Tax=candidate division Kazan bacterium TaxID=2202143 RepID=A0A420ZCA1_UNCK3|nr:MAG: hypothetical protein DRH29_03145 [candidate division Kazan bacterium]
MNFKQAMGGIEASISQQRLAYVLRTARAPANWSRFTSDEQQKILAFAGERCEKIAKAQHLEVDKHAASTRELIKRAGNPHTAWL